MKTRGKKKSEDMATEDVVPEGELFVISTKPSEVNDNEDVEPEVEESQSAETADEDATSESKTEVARELKRKREEKKERKEMDKKERFLEDFLFGAKGKRSGDDNTDSSDSDSDEEVEGETVQKSGTVARSDGASDSDSDDESDAGNKKRKKSSSSWSINFDGGKGGKKPAWRDEDDDKILVKDVAATFSKGKGKHGAKETSTESYAKTLERKFVSMVGGTPKWAELRKDGDEDADSDDEFFRETTDMLERGRKASLSSGRLEYRKLQDLNHSSGHVEGTVIRATEFHPSAAVALVAGLNGAASLIRVDGKDNPKMQTVNFEDYPIRTAHFSADGREFIVASRQHQHFYVYDMEKGKSKKINMARGLEQGNMKHFVVSPAGDFLAFQGRFGHVHFLNARTKEKAFSIKMNDHIESFAFSPDGGKIYTHGEGGEVFIWDVRAQDCIHRFADEGSLKGTAIAVSPDNRFVAAGSSSGVVNIYERASLLSGGSATPSPEKAILNLTTSVAGLKFSPTSEMLAMHSELKENAIKLAHVPSMTVFNNFPPWGFNLKRANCLDFSLNGGYMAIGNNFGAANLYRLKHFGNF